ncbi:hypothetical protein [Kitasatospora sp. GP82]|uniref:hypothetical protein n=1 Tax=Kitasatospora sp. GP82 TaxID=3035089 RepID=UPI0024731F2A|nr:hypothetical protein [Kitasatospora sp. GP82]MDH6126908.1 hypothetical protein [Kitasatospora sp. GP82]
MSAHRAAHGAHRVPTEVPTPAQILRTGRVITTCTWLLTGAVVAVSMSTAAPFIDAHSPGWGTGPVMALAGDGCFILSLQADGTLARYEVSGGRWPAVFRWVTGLATVWLNIGAAALAYDLVGVVIHLIPPLLLLLVAEAGPAYRRALARLAQRTAQPAPDGPSDTIPEPVDTEVPTLAEEVPTAAPWTVRVPISPPLPPLWQAPAPLPPEPVSTPADHQVPTTAEEVPTTAEEVPTEVPTLTLRVAPEPVPAPLPQPEEAPVPFPSEPVSGLGDHQVPTAVEEAPAEVPTIEDGPGTDDIEEPAAIRLGEAEAAAVIERCWRQGVSQRETARQATRAPSYVGRVFKRLDAEHGQASAA